MTTKVQAAFKLISFFWLTLPLTPSVLGQESPAQPAPAAANQPQPLSTAVIKVKAKGTGVEISKVEVTLLGQSVTTDPQGLAKINIPASGDGKVRFFRKGYEILEVPFADLRPAGEFDIFLYPAVPDEDVIVITGKRKPQVSRKSVSIEESRRIAPGGDPAQVIKLLPGVQSQGYGSQVVVRGSGPRDSKYFIDDLEVPFIFHAIGDLSVIPAMLMREVEFDSGGFGPEYGNATGGVITIRTKNDIPERPLTEFVVNIPFYSGIFHTRPLSKDSSLTVSARRSYIDAVIRQALKGREDEAGGSITLVPYFGDAHIVYLNKSETGHTKTSLIAAYDGIKAALPFDSFADEDGKVKINFETAFLNLGVERMTRLNRDWKYTSTPQVYYLKTNGNFVDNEIDLKSYKLRVPTELTRRLSKEEEWVIGIDPAYHIDKTNLYAIDFREDDPTFDPEDAPKRKVVNTETFQDLAIWTAIDQQFGSLTLSPGVRGFYNSQIKKTTADPRLRSRYILTEAHALKGAIGQYSQAPGSWESSKDFGNPSLTYIRSMHYVLGLETKWSDAWVTELQAFYKTTKNAVTGNSEDRYDNEGSSRSRGAEIFIRRNLTSRLFGWLSYTYSKTEKRDSDQESFRDSNYDQTHVLSLVGSYKLTGIWELGGRYNHHTGDTYTPIKDTVYNANLDKYQERTETREQSSSRLPPYNALTLYLTRDFLFDTWKMSLKGGLESYWPRPQVAGISYNYDYSKEKEQKGLTAIPFLELRGEL